MRKGTLYTYKITNKTSKTEPIRRIIVIILLLSILMAVCASIQMSNSRRVITVKVESITYTGYSPGMGHGYLIGTNQHPYESGNKYLISNIPFQINGESLKKQINNGDIIEISIVGEELVFVVFGIQIIHTYPHILRIHQGFFPNGNPKPLIPKNPKQEKPLKAIITVKTRATPNPGF